MSNVRSNENQASELSGVERDKTTIQIFGLGYIGLPTAAIMARAGFRVFGVDVLQRVVDTINEGNIHIAENGLEELVRSGVTSGLLSASLEPQSSDVHIIAVPTPINEDKSPDISYVISATRLICGVLKKGDIVIVESTVPPFTCEGVIRPLILELTGMHDIGDYALVHCPERVIPGKIIHELVYNDRIIGGTDETAVARASDIYGVFVKGDLLKTTATAAELCKLMENTYRDVNIALANEFEAIGDRLGVNIFEAIALANHHPRVNIHTPSIGVGGHCIPVDPWFIVHAAPDQANLIRLARNINDQKPKIISDRIIDIVKKGEIRTIAVLGLSYKANVDDIRDSPSFGVLRCLASNHDFTILSADPLVDGDHLEHVKMNNVKFVDVGEAVEAADAVFILVDHDVFKTTKWKVGQPVFAASRGFSLIHS